MKSKISIIFFLLPISISYISNAQTLEKTYISDTLTRRLLSEFIASCEAACTLYDDMGVIKMLVYPDSGKEIRKMHLIASLDDSFKENPPQQFAHFAGRVILIYSTDENGTLPNPLPPDRIQFLLEEVGDRVFPAITRRGRWQEKYDDDGTLLSRDRIRLVKGGTSPYDIVYLINKKTGAVQRLKTL